MGQKFKREEVFVMTVELIVWLALLALLVIIEAATAQLVTIWFAAGALVAVIAELCNAPLYLEIILFVAVSLIALIVTRPLVRRFTTLRVQPTNADRNIGGTAVVLETIDNLNGKGSASINGVQWSARSADDTVIPQGTLVRIDDIQGVKLIVTATQSTVGSNS